MPLDNVLLILKGTGTFVVVLTHPVGLSRSVTSRPPKAVLLLQIEIIRPGMRLPSQSVTDRADIHAKMLQIEMFGDRDKKPAPVWWVDFRSQPNTLSG